MARIYQTFFMGEAHVRVALMEDPGMADLCVYRVNDWGWAQGDDYWFITPNKQDATVYVFFGSIGFSQVKICFVDNRSQTGWQGSHPLKGRFS